MDNLLMVVGDIANYIANPDMSIWKFRLKNDYITEKPIVWMPAIGQEIHHPIVIKEEDRISLKGVGFH